ncbi:MAG: VWA domain-containing protein [Acidobacteria bacterium]|nr:VWA domain-containing protein [Acidobacteriota bacterium]
MTWTTTPLVLSVVLTAQNPPVPSLEIVSPTPTDYVVGETTIYLDATPGNDRIVSITVAVDGALACRLTSPPYRCHTTVGPELRQRTIRVVAILASGRRIVRTMSTADVPLVETSEVRSVLVPVSVRDSRGRFVPGLQRENFALFENDRAQAITFFAPEGSSCEIILAVDISGSMADQLGKVQQAVKTFLAALRPDDTVTLAAFNTAFFTIAPRGASAAARHRAIDRLASWGGTALYDAMFSALDVLTDRQGRRSLVVFTDGEDRSSQASPTRVEQRLLADDVVLYVVGHGSAADLPALRDQLKSMAEASGGRAIFLSSLDKADEAFREVMEDLAQLYTLGFSPDSPGAPGEWRKLRVELARRKYRVRSRAGYVLKSSR